MSARAFSWEQLFSTFTFRVRRYLASHDVAAVETKAQFGNGLRVAVEASNKPLTQGHGVSDVKP